MYGRGHAPGEWIGKLVKMRSSMPPYWCVGSVTCWLNQGVVGKCVGGALLKSPVTIIFDSEFSSL